jgi:hypothetical protein
MSDATDRQNNNMPREFVIVTGSNVYTGDKFPTFKAAKDQAEIMADNDPGAAMGIYELVAISQSPKMAVRTTRRYGTEHYK